MYSRSVLDTLGSFVPPDNLILDAPMSSRTTFRVGGPAACLVEPENGEQLAKIAKYANLIEIPYFVLGNGSNTLVKDTGYDGLVIHIGKKMSDISVEGNLIRAQAGAMLVQVAKTALAAGLTGMEFAAGIPGSVGGGVVMNAGAYDGEMSFVVKEVTVVSKEGEIMTLSNSSMEFAYRHSVLRKYPFIVTEVLFELKPGDPNLIRMKMEDFNIRRRTKQPLEYASAGSTFKRPEGHFAGQLIMEAGMRGFQIGGARVSDKHCGFVINVGNASAEDILDVIGEVKERVKMRFDVDLEPEIVILG